MLNDENRQRGKYIQVSNFFFFESMVFYLVYGICIMRVI